MLSPSLSDPELRRAVLKPLLQDFQFWFKRTRDLLEQEHLPFLAGQEQSELLARVRKNQQQVTVAQSLLDATEEEAGIEMTILMPWHQLVLECWQITMRFRNQQAGQASAQVGPQNPTGPQSNLGAYDDEGEPLKWAVGSSQGNGHLGNNPAPEDQAA